MGVKSAYWADTVAEKIIKTRGLKHVVATGITPSGPIHLGNLREVLTADAVHRALFEQKAKSRLIYIADTADPLRKVYPFLPTDYEKYVGMPLYRIPDPEGCCSSYAEHFLSPFLESLKKLGISLEVFHAHQLYRQGAYRKVISQAIKRRDEIVKIISSQSGRQFPKGWFPYQVECEKCRHISNTEVTSVDVSSQVVSHICKCGYSGSIGYGQGQGKLPWRVDWPARWKVLGVTVEPFGKDHAVAGGSYDTGKEISEKIFDYPAPYPIIYEWIYLKGKGAMASSTGVAISIAEMLEVVPPEVVRFLVLRIRPEKHIEFDPTTTLLSLVDEYQEVERAYFNGKADELTKRIYEFSQVSSIPEEQPLQIPFIHMAIVVQTAGGKKEKILEILKRSGYSIPSRATFEVERLAQCTQSWLGKFAPDDYKFNLQPQLPPAASALSPKQKDFLAKLAERLNQLRGSSLVAEKQAEEAHNLIHQLGLDLELPARKAFQAVYISLLGKKSGPRAGWFITSLDSGFVTKRFLDASK